MAPLLAHPFCGTVKYVRRSSGSGTNRMGRREIAIQIKGNHLSNTSCLTHVFFKVANTATKGLGFRV